MTETDTSRQAQPCLGILAQDCAGALLRVRDSIRIGYRTITKRPPCASAPLAVAPYDLQEFGTRRRHCELMVVGAVYDLETGKVKLV